LKASPEDDHLVFRRVLVAVDGSPNSARAARVAVTMAKKYEAELHVLHVIPQPPYMLTPDSLEDYYRDTKKAAERWVDEVVSLGNSQGLKVKGMILEHAPSVVEFISDYAAKNEVDLVVVGTRGLGGFKKLVIGSTSAGTVSHAPCSVLVVR